MKNYIFPIANVVTVITLLILVEVNGQPHQALGSMSMQIDETTGVPITVFNAHSKMYAGSPTRIARAFLEEHKELFKIKNMDDVKISKVKLSPAGTHVSLSQHYKGFKVHGSSMVISIDSDGYISTTSTKKILNSDK